MRNNDVYPSDPMSTTQRRDLRHNPTDAERALWQLLRGRQLAGAKFRRQHSVGPYILDFFSLHRRLAIELDGSQHYSPEGLSHDAHRTRYLLALGIRVVRFSDRAVLNERNAVLTAILCELEDPSP
jgi:very-short-patch-repair endonuclease